MATNAGDYIQENLTAILKLNDLDSINNPDAMLIAANRTKMFNFLEDVRALVAGLNSIKKPTLNLLAKDFRELYIERIRFIRERFVDANGAPRWTDYTEKNFGSILQELQAAEDDKYYFSLDVIFSQGFLEYITDPYYILLKAREYDYLMQGAAAATVTLTFALSTASTSDVTIPAETACSTSDGAFVFYTTQTVVIPTGSLRVNAPAINSRLVPETIIGSGEADQSYVLGDKPVIPSSIQISGAGSDWDLVNGFLTSRADDPHFTYELQEGGLITILFGNGQNGLIPNSNLDVEYRVGGGAAANALLTNSITRIISEITNANNQTVTNISVFNPAVPSGGRDGETLEQAKRNIKTKNRTSNRSIIPDDFEDNALNVPGVVRVFAVDRPRTVNEEINLVVKTDEVLLFVVPDDEGATVLSTSLIESIQLYFLNVAKSFSTVEVTPTIALYEIIDIEGQIRFSANSNPSNTLASIKTAIAAYFDYERKETDGSFTINWGLYKPQFAKSKITAVAESFNDFGVIGVDITIPVTDISIDKIRIPKLGSMDNLVAVDSFGNVLST